MGNIMDCVERAENTIDSIDTLGDKIRKQTAMKIAESDSMQRIVDSLLK